MKKRQILLVVALFAITSLSAQEKFGVATFTVPAGWQMTKNDNMLTIEKNQRKAGICKIIIMATENEVVNTEADYINYRKIKGGSNITYENKKGAVNRYESGGLIFYLSKGVSIDNSTIRSYFYSVTNGMQTFFYQLLTGNNACIEDFNLFVKGLLIDSGDGDSSQPSNTMKKKKVATPGLGIPPTMM